MRVPPCVCVRDCPCSTYLLASLVYVLLRRCGFVCVCVYVSVFVAIVRAVCCVCAVCVL